MGIKRRLRPAIDRVTRLTGLLRVLERRMSRGVTILTYHRILPDDRCVDYPIPSLAMPASAFREQAQWLAANCAVRPVGEALQALSDAGHGDRPCVCVTFDDGYADNFEIAAPILDGSGIRGTFFVTVGVVGTESLLWFDHAARHWRHASSETIHRITGDRVGKYDAKLRQRATLDDWLSMLKQCSTNERSLILRDLDESEPMRQDDLDCRMMSAEQMFDLHERGHEIGSHTLSHPILPCLEDDRLVEEVAESRRILIEKLGDGIQGFAYPNGDHDSRVVRAVQEAGYTYACTTLTGRNGSETDPFELRRIDMTADRVVGSSGALDGLGFRAEISLLREAFR